MPTRKRLLNEGLPAFRQEIQVGKKRRLRVRVGPYSDRADADAAAITIRAMGLDALVARQGA
jgi:cell division protein FtsN